MPGVVGVVFLFCLLILYFVLFHRRHAEPVALLVATNIDIVEARVGQMQSDFLRIVGVHPLNQLFPFLVVARESVVFVDDDEHAARL